MWWAFWIWSLFAWKLKILLGFELSAMLWLSIVSSMLDCLWCMTDSQNSSKEPITLFPKLMSFNKTCFCSICLKFSSGKKWKGIETGASNWICFKKATLPLILICCKFATRLGNCWQFVSIQSHHQIFSDIWIYIYKFSTVEQIGD